MIDARELRSSTGRYVERLLHYLQELDKIHSYIVLLKPEDFEDWQPKNPKFEKVVCPYKEFTFSEQLSFWRQLKKIKPDLVHFPMAQQPLLYSGKTVTSILDLTTARFRNPAKNWLVFRAKQQVYRWLVKRVARKSAKVITISEFSKEDVAQYCSIPLNKIVVTYPAADKITAKPEPVAELKAKHYLLYVGRALPHKNLERLVDAYQEVKWSYPDLHLVLAGKLDDNYRLLSRYVDRKKISGVILTDFVTDSQLRWLYEHASAYVFPSLSEGFGLPGLEAMLYKLPVISSNAACLPEIYGGGALYFDPLSVQDMAAKIKQLLDDKDLAKELSQKGYDQAERYSWRRMAKQTLDIYNEVLARKR